MRVRTENVGPVGRQVNRLVQAGRKVGGQPAPQRQAAAGQGTMGWGMPGSAGSGQGEGAAVAEASLSRLPAALTCAGAAARSRPAWEQCRH